MSLNTFDGWQDFGKDYVIDLEGRWLATLLLFYEQQE